MADRVTRWRHALDETIQTFDPRYHESQCTSAQRQQQQVHHNLLEVAEVLNTEALPAPSAIRADKLWTVVDAKSSGNLHVEEEHQCLTFRPSERVQVYLFGLNEGV